MTIVIKKLPPRGNVDPNAFWIMAGLIYPGILGALLYEVLFPKVGDPAIPLPDKLLMLLLLVQYAFDFAYTVREEQNKDYGWCQLIVDAIIVWLMYESIESARTHRLADVCSFMLLTKGVAIVWELIEGKFVTKNVRRHEIYSDVFAAVPYVVWLLIAFLSGHFGGSNVALAVLILAVIFDIALYFVHDRATDPFKKYMGPILGFADQLETAEARP